MKKIFALFALCLFLSGCVDVTPPVEPSPGEPSPVASPLPPKPSPPPASPEPTDAGLVRAAVNALIDIDWPETNEPPDERVVFPLTNTEGVYRTSAVGKITFVDTELNPVALPFEPATYAVAGSGYAVVPPSEHLIQPDVWVLMLGDGTLPTDENGQYYGLINIGADRSVFDAAGNTVVTFQTVDSQNAETVSKFGLYDMKERREVLPREYGQIYAAYGYTFNIGLFFAEKNGQWTLHDQTGRVLYNLNGVPDDYDLNAKNHIFYRQPINKKVSMGIDRWDEYFLVYIHPDENSVIIVTDGEGQELYRRELNGYRIWDDELYIQTGDEWFALDKDLNERSASEPPEEEAGPIRYTYPGHHTLVNPNGETVAETDGNLWVFGDFALLTELMDGVMRTDPKAVYALDGTLLLDNVYGWIDEVPAPGGGLFVYLDPETCVLLMPDGSTTPVPAAPKVEKVYHGG